MLLVVFANQKDLPLPYAKTTQLQILAFPSYSDPGAHTQWRKLFVGCRPHFKLSLGRFVPQTLGPTWRTFHSPDYFCLRRWMNKIKLPQGTQCFKTSNIVICPLPFVFLIAWKLCFKLLNIFNT